MDETLKQQLMMALVVFNLTVVAYVLVIYFVVSKTPMYLGDLVIQALIGAVIGLVTGGITLGITMMGKK